MGRLDNDVFNISNDLDDNDTFNISSDFDDDVFNISNGLDSETFNLSGSFNKSNNGNESREEDYYDDFEDSYEQVIPLGSPKLSKVSKPKYHTVEESDGGFDKFLDEGRPTKAEQRRKLTKLKGENDTKLTVKDVLDFAKTKKGMVACASLVAVVVVCGFVLSSLLSNSSKVATPTDIKIAESTPIQDAMQAAEMVSKVEFKKILVNSGYEESEAQQAIDSDTTIDWKKNAYDRLKLYTDNIGISEDKARTSMKDVGFTDDEIEYAISGVEAIDWNAQAVKRGDAYLQTHVVTSNDMIKALMVDGFTREQAKFASENLPCDAE